MRNSENYLCIKKKIAGLATAPQVRMQINLSKEHCGTSHEELLSTFMEARAYQGRRYNKYCTAVQGKVLSGVIPKRKICAVDRCQLGILRSLFNLFYWCYYARGTYL